VGIRPEERLTLALSGGADSTLLLHLLAAADPRPAFRVVHLDHGLRGPASRADARFCRNLCRALGVPYRERRLDLDPRAPSLEAVARRARYEALVEQCRETGHRTLLTGHHSDDALETLLMRWVRGTAPAGLRGPYARRALPEPGEAVGVRVVRPLIRMRREEVRRLLSDRGLRWREDRSNEDPRFTRNRVRHAFLPALREVCGTEGIENLRAFGRAVENLEDRLAAATAHLAWGPGRFAALAPLEGPGGGLLSRAALMQLAAPLRRRALWRLLVEGTGRAPGRRLLERLLDDLGAARCTRHSLPGGWSLWLRSAELHLLPPAGSLPSPAATLPATAQPSLPFPGGTLEPEARRAVLPVPGILTLPDGRRLSAERVGASTAPPGGGLEVELDAKDLDGDLHVRFPRPGDRFHPLGGPGTRRVVRFLADRGVPRELRDRIPLVLAGEEILWVAGFEPGHRHRIGPATRRRLRLCLHHA